MKRRVPKPSLTGAALPITPATEKQAEVAGFAKFLLAREGDARWEEIINDPQPRPKLEAFIEKAVAEGSERLDLDRMGSRARREHSGMRSLN